MANSLRGLTLPSATAVAAPTTSSSTALTSSTASSGSGSAIGGTWTVASGSLVGYRVKEVLFGQSAEAVGRTSGVTGKIVINGTTVTAASFTADMTGVASNESRRDGQFRGRIMNVSTYPTATFTLTRPIELSALPATGRQVTVKGAGNLTVHGVTKTVTVDLAAQRADAAITVAGSIPVQFTDYGISSPSGGPAQVENNGLIEFRLALTQ